ncbi:MAG: hypothetical protein MSH60_04645 [Ruminococcus sp.]|nr:hypothetical protein [Ruminococcus sp.]
MKENKRTLNQDEVVEMVDVLMEYFGRDVEGNLYVESIYSYFKLFFLAVCFLIAETADETEQSISKVNELANKYHNDEELNEFHRAFEKHRSAKPKSLAVKYYDRFIQTVGKCIVTVLSDISVTFQLFLFIPDERCNFRRNFTFAEILNMGKEEVRQKREDEAKWYKSIKNCRKTQ